MVLMKAHKHYGVGMSSKMTPDYLKPTFVNPSVMFLSQVLLVAFFRSLAFLPKLMPLHLCLLKFLVLVLAQVSILS